MSTDLAVIEAALKGDAKLLSEITTFLNYVGGRPDSPAAIHDRGNVSKRIIGTVLAHELIAELVERVKAAEWATTVQQCSVSHEDPYDFDYCETHDRTFPIGGKCDHAGISELDYWVDQASTQRGRAVRAEMRAEIAEATIARVRELADEHPGTAWNSDLNLRQALRGALGATQGDAPDGADSADGERNRFTSEVSTPAPEPILRPTDQRAMGGWVSPGVILGDQDGIEFLHPAGEPPAVDDCGGCCR